MSDTITLFCLVHGEPASNAFPVKIPQTDTVSELKNLIKMEKVPEFNHVAANKLVLWKVNIPTSDKAKLQQFNAKTSCETAVKDILGGEKIEDPTEEIQEAFGDEPLTKQYINIIVECPACKCYFYMSSFHLSICWLILSSLT